MENASTHTKKQGTEIRNTSSSAIFSTSSSSSCIGRLKTRRNNEPQPRINYYVIGTSHFRCNSCNEVSALIRRKQPDGVVIELDPERLLRLTLDDATVRAAAAATSNKPGNNDVVENDDSSIENRWFGGDFLSAIETSKELDIPLFLGDEYPIETRQRFLDTLLDIDSYNPENLWMATLSLFRPRRNAGSEIRSVDIVGTFWEDPRKLVPLVATLSLPILAVAATMLIHETGTKAPPIYESFATLVSLVASFLASCKVYNNLIADRDAVLASNAQRAATTMALLKSNQLIRKRWTFSVYDGECDETDKPSSTAVPLFTLKNALEKDAVRNLNLFEPRWLKMIDRFLAPKAQQQDLAAKQAESAVQSERRTIGCVTCTNKFYSAINVAEDSKNNNINQPSSFQEGRYADVIFRRRGRIGEVLSIKEGSRPSGARKVGVKIFGKEAFELPSSEEDISVVKEGYLVASGLKPIDEEDFAINSHDKTEDVDEINIVVVVGLLHANGVLNYLQKN